MPKFTDIEGHSWDLAITIAGARRLKEEAGVDILEPQSLQSAVDDPFKEFDVLAGICNTQMREISITVEDFDRRLADAAVHDAACQSLREALAAFFGRMGRGDLSRLVERTTSARKKLQEIAVAKIESKGVSDAIDRLLAKAEQEMDRSFQEGIDRLEATLSSSREPAPQAPSI